MSPVITTEKLSKSFSQHGTQVHVLRNLDLEIHDHDLTVIMGPSGAGKSTLLYALSGMDRPSLGTITVDGTRIERMGEDRLARFRRDHCGFVFQQIHLMDAMSVRDNVLAIGLLGTRRRDSAAVREHAESLFDQVGLDEGHRTAIASTLSGGEAQRAGLVRALVRRPRILFADEPTGQLNSVAGEAVLDLMTALNAEGQCILMVTHDLRSALRGTRVLYLQDGSLRGELHQGPFDPTDDGRRERLTTFLEQMGW
ncbi:MAG: ABC transporter ATP-binding protein, partial [Brachybacterium sp.]|nr:ABC transporter ATP-binding protein [Brachybacterium sp.]